MGERVSSDYRPFSTQFRECSDAGHTQKGPPETHEVTRMTLADPTSEFGFRTLWGKRTITVPGIICGKFGGRCSSRNPGCVKLRNAE